jgi:hypothetical protein
MLVLICLTITLSGCGHHRYFKGFEEIPSESASVYVIRPNHFVGMALNMWVKAGDKKLGYLKSGHFLNTFLEPGKHTVLVTDGDSFTNRIRKLEFSVKPNERVYFVAGFGLEGYFGIEKVSAETALKELQEFTED